ncbi:universal stress protein [Silvibacterium dinghuense]|uniref:Universal stress protein n=1 Tax=Silvibacterium dinghuense TaxID=1560006 RepID=A0A4Q1S9R5_9BACT|nr:universal stress protein [Silvibacterium dinghuense]RXS93790.1 universal stress protein [Silvibacterium dinghuense]GGH07660.1 hypothetical protein GCM10011586_24970 [Silvibacterium dinghuense]
MFRNIAVAYEDRPESARAFARAVEFTRLSGARLMVVAIAEPLPAYTAYSAASDPSAIHTLEQDKAAFYEAWKQRMVETGRAEGVEISAHVLTGNTVRAVVEFTATHEIDLLVVGLHRHSLRMSSLWSVVYSLAQEVDCSILGVH